LENELLILRASTKRELTEEPTRRVAQRRGETSEQETEEEKTLETIILKDLRSGDERVLEKVLGELWENYLESEDKEKRTENLRSFFLVGGPVVVVQVMDDQAECTAIQNNGLDVLMTASYDDDEPLVRTAI
jgi:hypothetical protein